LARRTNGLSMLTRWLLCASMMLSMLCIIYLCLAVLRVNKQRRRRLHLQHELDKAGASYWAASPPTYEKLVMPPGYTSKLNEEKPETPPPTYEIASGQFLARAGEPAVKEV